MSDEYAVPVAGALVLNENDEVLLIRSPKWGGQWTVPGGKVERGVSMRETVEKEVREETGLEVTDVEFLEATDPGIPDGYERDLHLIYLDFVCRAEHQEVELDGREAVDHVWIGPEAALESDLEIPDSTREFVRTWLRE